MCLIASVGISNKTAWGHRRSARRSSSFKACSATPRSVAGCSAPVKLVRKPSGRRQRAIVLLPPRQVEAVRAALMRSDHFGDATLVSVLAYAGLRPQEALALEWRHIRDRTLVVEQKNVNGELIAGQKTRRPPRTIDLISPLRSALLEWRMRRGNPASGLVFPTRKGQAFKEHDWLNWNRRVWTPAARALGIEEPPYTCGTPSPRCVRGRAPRYPSSPTNLVILRR